ncbi:MAG: preprotein translocase subunit SecG [Thermodesulfobacteriota bacterium]
MFTAVAILHVLVCVFLILVVLLQTGKGSDIGAVFGGGGSQALFGSAGPGTFLGKLTAVMAGIFMLTSILIAGNFFARPSKPLVEEPISSTQGTAQESPPASPPQVPEKAPQN